MGANGNARGFATRQSAGWFIFKPRGPISLGARAPPPASEREEREEPGQISGGKCLKKLRAYSAVRARAPALPVLSLTAQTEASGRPVLVNVGPRVGARIVRASPGDQSELFKKTGEPDETFS
jgi:hypothetical protein